jgi:hypothetical protein
MTTTTVRNVFDDRYGRLSLDEVRTLRDQGLTQDAIAERAICSVDRIKKAYRALGGSKRQHGRHRGRGTIRPATSIEDG